MYAHVSTYRLGTSEEVAAEVNWADREGEVISDQTARTIASQWHSPAKRCHHITALSHGRPFDTDGLREEIPREIGDWQDQDCLLRWLDALEAHLTD